MKKIRKKTGGAKRSFKNDSFLDYLVYQEILLPNDICMKLGVSRSLWHWWSNNTQSLTLKNLKRIAEAGELKYTDVLKLLIKHVELMK